MTKHILVIITMFVIFPIAVGSLMLHFFGPPFGDNEAGEIRQLELKIQCLEADLDIRDNVIDCLVNSNNALVFDLDKWRGGDDE